MATQKNPIKMIGRVWKLLYYTTRGLFFIKVLQTTVNKPNGQRTQKSKVNTYTKQLFATLKPLLKAMDTTGVFEEFKLRMTLAFSDISINKQLLGFQSFMNPMHFEGLSFSASVNLFDYLVDPPQIRIEGTKVSYLHKSQLNSLHEEAEYFNVSNYLFVFNESLDISVIIYLDDINLHQVHENYQEEIANSPLSFDLVDVLPIKEGEQLIVMTICKLTLSVYEAEGSWLRILPEYHTAQIIDTYIISTAPTGQQALQAVN